MRGGDGLPSPDRLQGGLPVDARLEDVPDARAATDAAASTVAVCVCTCDRSEGLANCLRAVARADRTGMESHRLFVIVVDNRPKGRVRSMCDELAAETGLTILLAEEPVPGISFARNRALAEAFANGADFVAFLDDDDEPLPDWLCDLVRTQRETGAELVFGRWMNRPEVVMPRYLSGVPYLHGPAGEGLCNYGLPRGIGTFNVLIARSMVERLAPDGVLFVPELALCGGSDRELFIRAHNLGVPNALAPRSFVMRSWGPERLSTRGIVRRSFRLGHSKAVLQRRFRPPEISTRKFRRNLWDLPFLVLGLAHPKRWKSKRSRMSRLYKVAKTAGEINGYLGRRLHYYGS